MTTPRPPNCFAGRASWLAPITKSGAVTHIPRNAPYRHFSDRQVDASLSSSVFRLVDLVATGADPKYRLTRAPPQLQAEVGREVPCGLNLVGH